MWVEEAGIIVLGDLSIPGRKDGESCESVQVFAGRFGDSYFWSALVNYPTKNLEQNIWMSEKEQRSVLVLFESRYFCVTWECFYWPEAIGWTGPVARNWIAVTGWWTLKSYCPLNYPSLASYGTRRRLLNFSVSHSSFG